MKNTKPSMSAKVSPKSLKQMRKEINCELMLFRDWPISEEHAMKMVQDLQLMMQEDPEMCSLISWRLKNGITHDMACELRKKYPKFKLIYDEMKDHMAWRRLDRASERKHDASITKYVLPYFSKTFQDLEEWRTTMKAKVAEAGKSEVKIVEMPVFPSSNKVPHKGESNDM